MISFELVQLTLSIKNRLDYSVWVGRNIPGDFG